MLVLCTGNSARSVLGEALLGQLGAGRVRAYSAGSCPVGRVNPWALTTLAAHGLSAAGFRSKSWDEFSAPGAPAMDIVITVCDAAAGESCPLWPGVPLKAHWGLPDPAAAEGDEALRAAFEDAYAVIRRRVERLLALPFESMEREALQRALAAIGRDEEVGA